MHRHSVLLLFLALAAASAAAVASAGHRLDESGQAIGRFSKEIGSKTIHFFFFFFSFLPCVVFSWV